MLHLNMAISSAKMCILLLGLRLERSNCVLGKVLGHKMSTNGTRMTTMPSGFDEKWIYIWLPRDHGIFLNDATVTCMT